MSAFLQVGGGGSGCGRVGWMRHWMLGVEGGMVYVLTCWLFQGGIAV